MSAGVLAPGMAEPAGTAPAGALLEPCPVPDPFDAALWAEAEAWGTASPFQRLDWVRAHAETLGVAEGAAPRLVALRDQAGALAGLVPLALTRRAGLGVASIIGGRHASFHLPVLAPGAGPLDAGALRGVGRLVGADALLIAHVPRHGSTIAAGGAPSPSNAYELRLLATGEATLQACLSNDKRKKLRQKERYLAELGPVRHLVAGTGAEVARLLAAFLAQKAARFGELGIPDPFASPASRAFLARAALAGLERGQPAVELHGLLVGEQVAAVFGAAVDGRRAAGMFISFDAEPAFARCSPGDLLLTRVIAHACARGRTRFDLGVGEARYKSSFCPDTVELADVAVPVTARGAAYLAAEAGLRAAKRWVKSNPGAWKAVTLARRLRAGLARG